MLKIKEILDKAKEIYDYGADGKQHTRMFNQFEAKALLDYITNLQEEKQEMKNGWQEEIYEKDKVLSDWLEGERKINILQQRIDKTDKFLEELISSTKGVINDYSYHKEDNKILIELFEEDIEFYKKALDILRGDE